MAGPVHSVVFKERTITATWFDPPFRPIGPRVYSICFTDARQVVLVRSTTDPGLFLPGGGVEHGETIEEALVRELHEEIAERVLVPPEDFLSVLTWADDPACPLMFERALGADLGNNR